MINLNQLRRKYSPDLIGGVGEDAMPPEEDFDFSGDTRPMQGLTSEELADNPDDSDYEEPDFEVPESPDLPIDQRVADAPINPLETPFENRPGREIGPDEIPAEESVNREYWKSGGIEDPAAPYLNDADLKSAEPNYEEENFQPESRVQNELLQHLQNVPERQKNSFWRRLAAGLTGAAVAANEGPSRGISTTQGILDDPFRRHMQDWRIKGDALESGARQEGNLNSILARLSSEKSRRNLTKEINSMRFLQNLGEERGRSSRAMTAETGRNQRAGEANTAAADRADKGRKSAEQQTADRIAGAKVIAGMPARPRTGTTVRPKKTKYDKESLKERAYAALAKEKDGKWVKLFRATPSWFGNKDQVKLTKGKPSLNLEGIGAVEFADFSQDLQKKIDDLDAEDATRGK